MREAPLSAFPRQICRGLIEAAERGAHRAGVSAFPRQICRGLIEAEFRDPFRQRFPRQICRGLIEASIPATLPHPLLKPLGISPADLPGPH